MIESVFLESKMFQKTMFVYSKLYIWHPGDIICLTQAGILSSTSNFFATIAALWNKMRPQVKIIINVYAFRLRHSL